jgi:hypothetical protein
MYLSKKAIGSRFGLLAALVAALVIACTGVVLAQGSTANAGYENPNAVTTTSDAAQAGSDLVSNGSSAAGDVSVAAIKTEK